VDEEWMRPGQWFESVLCVHFVALTPVVGWQKDICPIKMPFHYSSDILLQNRWRRRIGGGIGH